MVAMTRIQRRWILVQEIEEENPTFSAALFLKNRRRKCFTCNGNRPFYCLLKVYA
jgi:hypothetical protein